MRLPRHIGIIPDGNRRFAVRQGRKKEEGYAFGLSSGKRLYEQLNELGIEEMTVYGFTAANTKRPSAQKQAFIQSCIDAVQWLSEQNAELLVLGNSASPVFPPELLPFTQRTTFGAGGMKINFLIHYSLEWDLGLKHGKQGQLGTHLQSHEVSRMDLILRWGDRSRLSGFLPVQSAYADFYRIPALWPDFTEEQVWDALRWYDRQEITLGG